MSGTTPHTGRIGLALLLGGWLATGVHAQPAPADDAAERARIERDIQAVQARHAQAQQVCAQRFQVNACLDEARGERRQALERLRREQAVLDDARRRARATERLQAQQRRQREREAQALLSPSAQAASAASVAAATAAAPGEPAASAPRQAQRPQASAAPAAPVAPAASANRVAQAAAHARRKRQAQQHAEAVRQRNAAQDARKPPAAGLPVPGPSGAAQR